MQNEQRIQNINLDVWTENVLARIPRESQVQKGIYSYGEVNAIRVAWVLIYDNNHNIEDKFKIWSTILNLFRYTVIQVTNNELKNEIIQSDWDVKA